MLGTADGQAAHRVSARRFDRRALWIGLSLSVLAHAGLLAFVSVPAGELRWWSGGVRELRQVEVPPRVEIPPPPETFPRPSQPEIATVDVVEAVDPAGEPAAPSRMSVLPEPPDVNLAGSDERPAVAPPEVAPSLESPEHFRRRLERSYPRLLRDRGVGGVVRLQFFVDSRGDVSRVHVAESSGHGSLDRVAERMAGEMRFLPALNRDRAVGVWVSQRICFATVKRSSDELTAAECEHRVALGGR